ncbi:transmembrane protein, putative [Medicago truncatula]|uniref:Transmembrane protein, putative n=1 Tax=Medicago truncatula TaxID=3880 RepID=G7K2R2_MEDTR|nr:transmembrane protein, putative [Medicago truncatula]
MADAAKEAREKIKGLDGQLTKNGEEVRLDQFDCLLFSLLFFGWRPLRITFLAFIGLKFIPK